MYASAVRLGAIAFISSMSASKDVLALASAEFEIGNIEPGSAMTVKWRGKPVFIRHRTADAIAKEEAVTIDQLRDPQVAPEATHLARDDAEARRAGALLAGLKK